MALRITTNGTLHAYKSNLMRSRKTLDSATEKMLTQRKFNSCAEDPASASQAFQLRRSMWRASDQITNSNAVINKFESAWKAIDSVSNDLGNQLANVADLRGLNGPTASGRQALGKTLQGAADAVLKTMNAQYGDTFIFAGADGLQVPFAWGADGSLEFRGIKVDVDALNDPDTYAKLEAMAKERTFVDIGLGMSERNGELIESSAFNSALSGLNFLGYGLDEDGDSQNIISLMKELGDIFSNCGPENGEFRPPEDEERANVLTDKLQSALSNLTVKYTELDIQGTFLNTNLKRLESTKTTLNTQILDIEAVDPAEAISDMAWAQYCYNAALKIGNSILSQSLLDYMN